MAGHGSIGRLWIVVGAALLVLGIGAALLLSESDSALPPSPDAPLPTPRPPEASPLAPAGAGGGPGWAWLNPRPRTMPTWLAVEAAGPGRVALVGHAGAAARFVDGSLVMWRTGTRQALRAVAWSGADTTWVAGDEGILLELQTAGGRRVQTSTDVDLRALAIGVDGSLFVGGDSGTILRVREGRVESLATGISDALLAGYSDAEDLYFVGGLGTILRLHDTEIHDESVEVGVALRGIGGCPGGTIYAVGDREVILRRDRGGTWRTMRSASGHGATLNAVGCDRGRAAIVGEGGLVLLASGPENIVLESGTEATWQGVSGAEGATTWLVGAGGRISSIETDHVVMRSSGPTVPLRDVSALGGALVAVGEWGRIVRQTADGFEESESPTDAGLAAIIALDEQHLLAVGDQGAVVEITHDRARLIPSDTDASLRGVLAGSDGRIVAVGTEGTVVRGTKERLTASRVAGVGDLWAIAGAPDDAIAVGEDGTVLHLRGERTTRWPCEARGLRALARIGERAFAVGAEGTIVRLEAGGCVIERQGGDALHAIVAGPDGAPLALGDDGAGWTRRSDRSWVSVDLPMAWVDVRGAKRLGHYVVLVGTGGAIVRRVIADGT